MSRAGDLLLNQLETFAAEKCAAHDPAHDINHVRRVVANTRAILPHHPEAHQLVTLAAAWLHDIVQLPKGSGKPGESARRSAGEASAWLAERGVDPDLTSAISHAIEAHSFSGGLKPGTIEAAIVQDADRLDALGAIGIARLWVTAGVLGSALHHPDEPAGHERVLDDRAFGLDHIVTKLANLPELMNTSIGRQLAAERASYVLAYRDRFLDEINGRS